MSTTKRSILFCRTWLASIEPPTLGDGKFIPTNESSRWISWTTISPHTGKNDDRQRPQSHNALDRCQLPFLDMNNERLLRDMNLLSDLSWRSLTTVDEKKSVAEARGDGHLAERIHWFDQQILCLKINAFRWSTEPIEPNRLLPFFEFFIRTETDYAWPVSKIVRHVAGRTNTARIEPYNKQSDQRNK